MMMVIVNIATIIRGNDSSSNNGIYKTLFV